MYSSSKESITFDLTLISSSGSLLMYDLRNCKIPIINQKDFFSNSSYDIKISFDPRSSHTNAVCGFDGNVYIIEQSDRDKNLMTHKFKHEGHMFTEDGSSCPNKITSSILWLPMCGSNTLLSAANDGSIQGWQYIS